MPYVTCVARTPQSVMTQTTGLSEKEVSKTRRMYVSIGTEIIPCQMQKSSTDMMSGCGIATRIAQIKRYATKSVGQDSTGFSEDNLVFLP